MANGKPGRPKGLPKTGGRKKGVVNEVTRDVKETILGAAGKLGGMDRLVQWATESDTNERVFWSQMYTKVLPKEIKADVAHEINHFSGDQLAKMAEEFLKKK